MFRPGSQLQTSILPAKPKTDISGRNAPCEGHAKVTLEFSAYRASMMSSLYPEMGLSAIGSCGVAALLS